MQSLVIVIHLYKLKNFGAGIFCILESTSFQHLGLKPAEKRFHMRLIVRIISIAHALLPVTAFQDTAEFGTCILTSTIGMNWQLITYGSAANCFLQRGRNKVIHAYDPVYPNLRFNVKTNPSTQIDNENIH